MGMIESREIACGLLQAGVRVSLEGLPGTGKSSFAKALADATDHHFEHFIGSHKTPSEVHGLEFMRTENGDQFVDHYPPPFLREIIEHHKLGVATLLVIDEATDCPRSIQSAIQSFLSEGRIGKHELPPETKILLCYNPPEVATNGHDFGLPFSNRFVHLDWTVDHNQWLREAANGFNWTPKTLSPEWKDHLQSARDQMFGFIMANPALLISMPEDGAVPIYPTPRAWYDMVSKIVAVGKQLGWNNETITQAVSGAVGTGAAVEYLNYIRNLDLPSPELILSQVDTFSLKTMRPDVLYVALNSCTTYSLSNINKFWSSSATIPNEVYDLWGGCVKLISRAANEGYYDIAFNVAKRVADFYNDNIRARKDRSRYEQPMRGLIQSFGKFLVNVTA